MNEELLNTGVQSFINKNLNADILSVLLKKSPFEAILPQELLQQISSKKKCKLKLPTWFKTPGIYYPKTLSIEQSSSEPTASYKAEIINGKYLLDLTGGFGVDSYFFAQNFEKVWHCEIDRELSEIAAHNFEILKASNVETKSRDGLSFLMDAEQRFDWVYIDPSRRTDSKGKVYKLEDCIPDVSSHLEEFFKKTNNLLVKTSPLLDIAAGLKVLKFVREIHIVAVNNEVKELLWILRSGFKENIQLKTINIAKDDRQLFNFQLSLEKKAISDLSEPLKYIYEPNAAIMKSGAFKLIGNAFSLEKLQEHTHLYTSDQLVKFPGRRFKLIRNTPYKKRELMAHLPPKANIATRNFQESVAEIRTRFKVKEGGEDYLFFITDNTNSYRVLHCSKV